MYLKNIKLKNFRNYQDRTFEFGDNLNFITGLNGTGKSNILEAISVLSNVRSFRHAADRSMINQLRGEYYYIKGIISEEDSDTIFESAFSVTEGIKKKFKINSMVVKKLIDYYGKFITVTFSPDDFFLVIGEPEKKRRYIDSIISKNDRTYYSYICEYRKILNNRNILLRERQVRTSDLDIWNILLAEKSEYIINQRIKFIKEISKICSRYYALISGEDSSITIKYKASLQQIEKSEILKNLEQNFLKDIRHKTTTIGPHRDSYSVLYQNHDCSKFASQGQKRALALSMRLAERDMVEALSGKKSVILVDDIFSELDKLRRHNLIRHICKNNQVIFTIVDTDFLDKDILHNSTICELSESSRALPS